MFYPSIFSIIREKEINLEAASPRVLENALWRAFLRDMPLATAYLEKLATEVKQTRVRIVRQVAPESALGQQLTRLLSPDVARSVCEQRLDVAIGFYSACIPVVAPSREELEMNPLEQIRLQQHTNSGGQTLAPV